ncbi:MAG: uracil phosphoribosyltransferase [Elusimicrobiota bacterium]
MSAKVEICEHPLMQEILAELRDRRTAPVQFRLLMEEAGLILGIEALRGVRMQSAHVQTPMKGAAVTRIAQPVVLTVVLRAGLGMLPRLSQLLPAAPIGHIGLYRDEKTLNPLRYYVRLPKDLDKSLTVLMDPMLATGGSASESIHILKTDGAKDIVLVTLLSTKPGIQRIQKDHPDVPIVTAAIDPVLNKIGYIVPGLGDAGDRLFGTE